MKKKLAVVGLLAGGIALTGLAGSAYAQGGTPTAKPAGPKGQGVVMACVKGGTMKGGPVTGGPVKGKPEKGKISIKEPGGLPALPKGAPPLKLGTGGKAIPASPSGAKLTKRAVKARAEADAHALPKLGPPPKGAHCVILKPGTPGTRPAPPVR
jgi:hypothetical protein